MTKRIVAAVITAVLAVGGLAACGSESTDCKPKAAAASTGLFMPAPAVRAPAPVYRAPSIPKAPAPAPKPAAPKPAPKPAAPKPAPKPAAPKPANPAPAKPANPAPQRPQQQAPVNTGWWIFPWFFGVNAGNSANDCK